MTEACRWGFASVSGVFRTTLLHPARALVASRLSVKLSPSCCRLNSSSVCFFYVLRSAMRNCSGEAFTPRDMTKPLQLASSHHSQKLPADGLFNEVTASCWWCCLYMESATCSDSNAFFFKFSSWSPRFWSPAVNLCLTLLALFSSQ